MVPTGGRPGPRAVPLAYTHGDRAWSGLYALMVEERHLGLFGATTLGVGAIVGGGILALAGVAFAVTGPGAILAFGLNGALAFLTVIAWTVSSSSS